MNLQMGRRLFGLLGVLLVGLVSFVWGCAQGAPEEAQADVAVQSPDMDAMKAMLVDGFERAKAWDLGIAEAIPDGAMDWAPNEDVRSFQDQVVHTANNGFISNALFGEAAPEMTVSEGSVPDKAALMSAIETSYDWIIERLRAMDSADLADDVEALGQTIPRWRVGTFALEHAMWTRGQMVPYFHANDTAVPDVKLF